MGVHQVTLTPQVFSTIWIKPYLTLVKIKLASQSMAMFDPIKYIEEYLFKMIYPKQLTRIFLGQGQSATKKS